MKISDMCEAERPRERLLAKGAEALGDAELLAILLRSGRPGESAVEMAHRLLGIVGGRLTGLFDCDAGYLASLGGVGPSRAAALAAAFELGRRFMQEKGNADEVLSGPQAVFARIHPRLKGLSREECWVILVDDKLREISTVRMTVGGRKSTVIDPSLIIRKALDAGASGVILIHNHPTGDPRPSRGDIRETGFLHDACNACGLRLQDHIIIGDEHFYSFKDEKMY